MFYRKSWDELAEELSGPHWFALAFRTGAYQGVMAARLAAMEDTSKPDVTREANHAPGLPPADKFVSSNRGDLLASDIGYLFEFGEG